MQSPISAQFVTFAVAGIAILAASEALAESESPPQQVDCVQAFENGQRLRKDGKLKAATEALISCSQPTCPAFIAKECTGLYTEAQTSLPSVALGANDEQGQPLTDVAVYLDGELLTKRLDGRAVNVDPGLHEFRFEYEKKPPVLIKSLVAEGEKNKSVNATFQDPNPGKKEQLKATAVTTTPIQSPEAKAASLPVVPFVVGGVGIVALAGGIILRLVADNDYDQLNGTCRPNCSDSQVSSVDRKYTISTISMAAGGVAIAGAAAGLLYFAVSGPDKSAPTAALSVMPLQQGQGALAAWTGRF
jgi:hypothetical protein